MSNNVLQKTKTAVGSFCILLPHNGLRVHQVLLPAVRQRFWLLSTGVKLLINEITKYSKICVFCFF